jgi:cytochrome c-type biogenesis protein CcmE
MTRKQARLYGLLLFMLGLGAATALTLTALSSNIAYFRTPTEVVTGNYPEKASGRAFRIGGLVEKGSLQHRDNGIVFVVTDLKNTLTVRYAGIIPDLFREGQGVVAEGHITPDGVFAAQTLLAKHDEKYMPPEVARALKGTAAAPARVSP